jgi:hypothetical protein
VAVLVSNNPYRLGRAIGSGTRPQLDQGLLGVAVIAPTRARRNGAVRHSFGMEQWTASTMEMQAESRVPAGIDGEAIHLDPPLQFRVRPGALRVRIAPGHPVRLSFGAHSQPSRGGCSTDWTVLPFAGIAPTR